MDSVEVSRHVAADPASVALLLAEPASERGHDGDVVVQSPRRAGVGFAAVAECTRPLGRVVTGEVVIMPSTDAGCDVWISFAVPDRSAARQAERAGSKFLDVLAARARSRSSAA